MDIILVRHAEAEDPRGLERDFDRPLTQRGANAFGLMLPRLLARLDGEGQVHLWTSPATRARQTAQLLQQALELPQMEEHDWIYEGRNGLPLDQLAAAQAGDTLIIVGHQPHLSYWAYALTRQDIPFKKGAAVCLRYRAGARPPAWPRWQLRPGDEAQAAFPGLGLPMDEPEGAQGFRRRQKAPPPEPMDEQARPVTDEPAKVRGKAARKKQGKRARRAGQAAQQEVEDSEAGKTACKKKKKTSHAGRGPIAGRQEALEGSKAHRKAARRGQEALQAPASQPSPAEQMGDISPSAPTSHPGQPPQEASPVSPSPGGQFGLQAAREELGLQAGGGLGDAPAQKGQTLMETAGPPRHAPAVQGPGQGAPGQPDQAQASSPQSPGEAEPDDPDKATRCARALAKDVDQWRKRFIARPQKPRNAHQLRVSLRKARSWLSFLRPLLDREDYDRHQDALRHCARALTQLRETDVLLLQVEELKRQDGPSFPALTGTLRLRREREAQAAHLQVQTPEYTHSLEQALDYLAGMDCQALFTPDNLKALEARLARWQQRALAELGSIDFADIARAHALRLRLKKLANTNAMLKDTGILSRRPIKGIKGLRRDLGTLCDLDAHARMLRALAGGSDNQQLAEEVRQALNEMALLADQLRQRMHQAR